MSDRINNNVYPTLYICEISNSIMLMEVFYIIQENSDSNFIIEFNLREMKSIINEGAYTRGCFEDNN